MVHHCFSHRTPNHLAPSPLAVKLAQYTDGIDLSISNPTRPELAFDYPYDQLADVLAQSAHGAYAAEPVGMLSARQAVCDYLHAAGMLQSIGPDRIILTASTSEAYSMVIKLLCDPGDRIAVGAPGYPLVQHLAELESVVCDHFEWFYAGNRWNLQRESVLRVLDGEPRDCVRGPLKAIVIVGPNNPTGACLDGETWQWLCEVCTARGVAIIADEVFAPYGWHGGFLPGALRPASSVHGTKDGQTDHTHALPLMFVLDGLSKAAGLPQMKLAWTVVAGPDDLVQEALQRLEWIGDTYLSASAPIQRALPGMLAIAPGIQDQIRERVISNYRMLQSELRRHDVHAVELLQSEGGWYAVLRVPRVMDEDAWVLHLAHHAGVIVQPGYYFDFASDGYLVVGLLQPTTLFTTAVQRMVRAMCDAL